MQCCSYKCLILISFKKMKTIKTIEEFATILANAKCGGQFVTLTARKAVKLNKYPTDGSEKIRINDDFVPMEEYTVEYHFGADYEKAMAKALGIKEYDAHDANRFHIVPSVLMAFKSTKNVCAIYMPSKYRGERKVTLNGRELSSVEKDYMRRYTPKHTDSVVEYRNLSLSNIKRLALNHEVYEVDIKDSHLYDELMKVTPTSTKEWADICSLYAEAFAEAEA